MIENGIVTNLSRGTVACMLGVAISIGIPWATPGVIIMCVIFIAMDA